MFLKFFKEIFLGFEVKCCRGIFCMKFCFYYILKRFKSYVYCRVFIIMFIYKKQYIFLIYCENYIFFNFY